MVRCGIGHEIFGTMRGVMVSKSTSLPSMFGCQFKSRLGLGFSGFGMWHFLKLVLGGFLWVLWFAPFLHGLTMPLQPAPVTFTDEGLWLFISLLEFLFEPHHWIKEGYCTDIAFLSLNVDYCTCGLFILIFLSTCRVKERETEVQDENSQTPTILTRINKFSVRV